MNFFSRYGLLSIAGLTLITAACKEKAVVPQGPAVPVNSLTVSTFAGSGLAGHTDGNGTQASFAGLWGIAIDAAGNIYATDQVSNTVRKITAQGTVSTIADDGQGLTTIYPDINHNTMGIAVDHSGNIYESYSLRGIIRKVTPGGAGSLLAGYGGLGVLPGSGNKASVGQTLGLATDESGNVYAASVRSVIKINPQGVMALYAGNIGLSGFKNGSTTDAEFYEPEDVAIAADGTVYVADTYNNVIRKIAGGRVSTFAGTGERGFKDGGAYEAEFSSPSGLTVDIQGNVYVADTENNAIRKITPDGMVSTYAGTGKAGFTNGAADKASFNFPRDVAADAAGNLYVTDSRNNVIRVISQK